MAETMSALYFSCIVVLASYFFILAGANIVEIRRYTRPPSLKEGPLVSVLIPVRNEAEHIQRCLAALMQQEYRNYEILVLDDNSQDKTWAILNQVAQTDSRIRIFSGAPLPDDWYGKPYALQQLAGKARGEILIMTDADTVHSPSSISWTVTNIQASQADFISGYVRQELRSFGEKITVPLMFFLTGFIIPLCLNQYTKCKYFSVAIGQFIAIRKDVFMHIGGFTTIRKKTSEDMYLARYVKSQGFKTLFLDMGEQVHCRMYTGYKAAVEGIGKNIFDFLGNHSLILVVVSFVVLFFLFLPFPLLFLLPRIPHYQMNLLAVNILYTLTWMMLFIDRKIPWYYGLLWPLMILNLMVTALWSWFRAISGRGFVWKGRIVS
ncbi:MAG: glycosyltransferase [Treponema sp.]|jgi:chlorobactene glucosyltransferase|nr:glycosyltransferase [Treponema sp.]